jgi:hypothetical protein
MTEHPKLSFPYGFDERDAIESEERGYFGQAIVELPTGARVKVCFYDPVRLSQDLETMQESGEVCLAEAGLIVLPSVTLENMEKAIQRLYTRRYFDGLVPLAESPNGVPGGESR